MHLKSIGLESNSSVYLHMKVLLLIVLLTPFIDVLNGILLERVSISPGQIFRIGILIYGVYILAKYSFKLFLLFMLILIVSNMSLLFSIHLYGVNVFLNLIWDIRIIFTIVLILLFIMVIPFKSNYSQKLLYCCEFSMFIISIVILYGTITGAGFQTYDVGVGGKGFFQGQNDLSAVFSMLFPLTLVQLILDERFRLIRLINLMCTLLAIVFLGTKSAIISVILGSIITISLTFFSKRKKTLHARRILILSISLVISVILVALLVINKFSDLIEDWINYQLYFLNTSTHILTYILSGRNLVINPILEVYKNNPLIIFFGTSFEEGQRLLSSITGYFTFVEFDPLAVLFYKGLIEYCLITSIFIYIIKYSLYLLKGNELDKAVFVGLWGGILNSAFAAHVIASGLAGTYLAIISGLAVYFGKKIRNNKMT